MKAKLENWFSLAMYENEEDRHVGKVLLGLDFTFLFGALLTIVLGLIWGDRNLTFTLFLGCCFQIIPLALLFRGNLLFAAYVTVIEYIAFITITATLGLGIRDYVIVVYPAAIVFAGLADKQRGLITSTLLTFVSLAWLILGEIYSWYTVARYFKPTVFDLLLCVVMIALVAVEVDILVSNLKDRVVQLRESEEKLEEIFDNSPDNIFVFDICADGRFRLKSVNSALEKVFNANKSNLEGKYLEEILDASSVETITRNFKRCIEHKTQVHYEEFAELPGKTYATTLIPILDELGVVIRLIGISRNITELKQLQEQELQRRAMEERQRLARDLHDAVSQTLFSARVTSEMLLQQKKTISSRTLWKNINHLSSLVKSALGEMRVLLLELRPESLINADLPTLLPHLVDAAVARVDAKINLNMYGRHNLPVNVKIAFYRIAQEALNNIIKHAACTEINIHLAIDESAVELTIADNGIGFNSSDAVETRMGLQIMRERAGEVGADLEIDGVSEIGTRITCRWICSG